MDLRNVNTVSGLLESASGNGATESRPWLWEEVVWAFIYLIWTHRNHLVFENSERKLEEQFFEFQRKCFEWLDRRSAGRRIDWNIWLANPRLIPRL